MVVLVVVLVLASLLVWRLTAARRDAAGSRPRYRFVAPDDDPDFLRELDRRTRRDDEPS